MPTPAERQEKSSRGARTLSSDSYNRPVLKAYVIKRLRQILPLEGYDPEEFSGHSIRIGGCQSLFDVEVDLRNIACAGR